MNRIHLLKIILVFLSVSFLAPTTIWADSEEVAAPASDETLIYVIREKRFKGGGVKVWIAVNDQTVARVRHKKYAVIRAKAGLITLNLAAQGIVLAATTIDDRPGEIVYLTWSVGDTVLTEVDEEDAGKLLKKSKRMKPLDAPLPNNEKIVALLNLSRLGYDLTGPATQDLTPNDEYAVITIFRRHDGEKFDFGIWSEHQFLGTLKVEQGLEISVPPGDHFFFAGNVGTTLLRAQVEAGKRYYAWLDFGKMIGRVRLTPVTRKKSSDLDKWLAKVSWVETDTDLITPRLQEREDLVTAFIRSATARAKNGQADFQLLGSEHAY